MSKRLTKEDFINKALIIHGDKYDYSQVIYETNRTKVKVVCTLHGKFDVSPSNHLKGRGCKKCASERQAIVQFKTTKQFILDAKKTHGDKFDYSKSTYLGCNENIIITCKEHGDFTQIPGNHLFKQGCPKCGKERSSFYHKENPTGWSHTNWQKAAERSKNFDSFKVYILECTDPLTDEHFFKIGKTYRKIDSRFKGGTKLPYNYKILETLEFKTALECSTQETHLKRINKTNKYIPLKSFNGMYECFSTITTHI